MCNSLRFIIVGNHAGHYLRLQRLVCHVFDDAGVHLVTQALRRPVLTLERDGPAGLMRLKIFNTILELRPDRSSSLS